MTTAPTTRGFTIIELMVVISIIALLAGLIVALIGPLRLRVKLADTKVRMDAVQQGIAIVGQSEGMTTLRLQQLTERVAGDIEPELGGVLTFGAPDPSFPGIPTIGKKPPTFTAPDGDWGIRGRAHLAFPWGKKFPDPTSSSLVMMGPERFLLRHMSPFFTRKLLKIANILPTRATEPTFWQTEYMTNRKPSEPWNDAWGHPLVVAATLYQPTHRTGAAFGLPGWKQGAWPSTTGSTNAANWNTTPVSPDRYHPNKALPVLPPPPDPDDRPAIPDQRSTPQALVAHLKLYQYNRSVYIAVAAVGPSARVTQANLRSPSASTWASSATTPTSGILNDLWAQANWVCQQAKEEPFDRDWSELSFDNPRWQGIKYDSLTKAKSQRDANRIITGGETYYDSYTGKEEHCLLTAPMEYR